MLTLVLPLPGPPERARFMVQAEAGLARSGFQLHLPDARIDERYFACVHQEERTLAGGTMSAPGCE